MQNVERFLGMIIASGFVLLSVGLTLVYIFSPAETVSGVDKQFTLLVGSWIVNFTTLVNFRYGSSRGSQEKTKLLIKSPPPVA